MNMLLRKKVVVFARLGGKLSVVRFPPSIIDQCLKKIVQKNTPQSWALLVFWWKKTPPLVLGARFFSRIFLWKLHSEYWAKREFFLTKFGCWILGKIIIFEYKIWLWCCAKLHLFPLIFIPFFQVMLPFSRMTPRMVKILYPKGIWDVLKRFLMLFSF